MSTTCNGRQDDSSPLPNTKQTVLMFASYYWFTAAVVCKAEGDGTLPRLTGCICLWLGPDLITNDWIHPIIRLRVEVLLLSIRPSFFSSSYTTSYGDSDSLFPHLFPKSYVSTQHRELSPSLGKSASDLSCGLMIGTTAVLQVVLLPCI